MAGLRLERSGSPAGVKRALFRSPIPIFRARLGFLFGKRLLMLEHTGRKSGETRRTVLEVVANHPDAAYVAAGWGSSAQWLKNVRNDPSVVFYLGSKRYPTEAEMVTEEEALALMGEYAARHGKTLGRLASFMLDDPGETPEDQAKRIAESVPMVRLPKE